MRTITLTLPAHWASMLINGDDTGLDLVEREAVVSCLHRENVENCLDVGEPFYTCWHDARLEIGRVVTECAEFTFEFQ